MNITLTLSYDGDVASKHYAKPVIRRRKGQWTLRSPCHSTEMWPVNITLTLSYDGDMASEHYANTVTGRRHGQCIRFKVGHHSLCLADGLHNRVIKRVCWSGSWRLDTSRYDTALNHCQYWVPLTAASALWLQHAVKVRIEFGYRKSATWLHN